jgi:hypothetical protein
LNPIISTQVLPPGYQLREEINLKKNFTLAISLNVLAILVSIACLFLAGWVVNRLRPGALEAQSVMSAGTSILAMILAAIATIVLHEVIHGLFFWLYTKDRPVFAIHPLYAYAAAPEWYIPKRQYTIIGLSPLVILDVLAVLFLLLGPEGWISIFILLFALNTGGAIGDLLIVFRLHKHSPACLANDTGHSISYYDKTK